MEPVRAQIVPAEVEVGIGATVELICTTRGSEPIELSEWPVHVMCDPFQVLHFF